MAHPDDPPPPVQVPTYLFTPRRLAVLGVLCAVLGAVILGNLGGGSAPSATPGTTSEAPTPPTPMPSPPPTPAAPSPAGPPAPTSAPPVGTVPPERAGIPRGTPPTPGPVSLADPTAVGEAFTAATFSYDANIDVSPAEAQRRSMQFATPSYAAKLQGSGTQPGGAQWSTLADHHGYITPSLPRTTTAAARPTPPRPRCGPGWSRSPATAPMGGLPRWAPRWCSCPSPGRPPPPRGRSQAYRSRPPPELAAAPVSAGRRRLSDRDTASRILERTLARGLAHPSDLHRWHCLSRTPNIEPAPTSVMNQRGSYRTPARTRGQEPAGI